MASTAPAQNNASPFAPANSPFGAPSAQKAPSSLSQDEAYKKETQKAADHRRAELAVFNSNITRREKEIKEAEAKLIDEKKKIEELRAQYDVMMKTEGHSRNACIDPNCVVM